VAVALGPHTLPPQPTTLIGREWEIANVCALMRRPAARLVTLTGPGGTGKTRLAVRAAAELHGQLEAGVCFVALAPVADAGQVAPAIAQALELRESAGQTAAAQIAGYLHGRRLLLVLDNFEHVLEAAPLVAELLAATPGLKILATSRAPLRLAAEQEFAVPPLRTPDHTAPVALERLQTYEAVRLFVERAQSVRHDFNLSIANAAAVAEICRRLDGLPLAIELAAVRSKLFPPQALLDRLQSPLALLTTGARDLPARQQTLRAAIDWSFRLLTPAEQALFTRLAIFVGGFTLDAAEMVAGDSSFPSGQGEPGGTGAAVAPPCVELISALLDQSLLRQLESAAGEPRLTMLETIREYALERLESEAGSAELRERHAGFFVALAERAAPALLGPEQGPWLARLEEEGANLRTALAWCAAHHTALGLRLAAALWPFWERRGHLREGRGWLEQLLQAGAEGPPLLRARALHGAGVLALLQGDYRLAELRLSESFDQFQRLGDSAGAAGVLCSLGLLAWFQGDHGAAQARLEQSAASYRAADHTWGTADALHYLGHVLLDRGDIEAARKAFSESLARFRATGDKRNIALPLKDFGLIAAQRGDYAAAAALYDESLALSREVGDAIHITDTLWRLGDLARLQGDHEQAELIYGQCLEGYQRLGNRGGIAEALNLLGEAAQQRRDYGRARLLYEESLAIQRELGSKRMIAAVLHNLGRVARRQGDHGEAIERYGESLALNAETSYAPGIADCLVGLAGVRHDQGDPRRAARLLGAAEPHLDGVRGFMPLADRDRFERARAAVREQLGLEAFEAERAAGQRLTLEQTIADAMGQPPSTPPMKPAPAAPTVAPGYPAGLTGREVEVLRLVAAGLSDAQVAEALLISRRTVHGHLRSIYGKLDVGSRMAAARLAAEHGLL
jgi:predicted ATPase/DNA-binding CsgD family transcriptional regulator